MVPLLFLSQVSFSLTFPFVLFVLFVFFVAIFLLSFSVLFSRVLGVSVVNLDAS